MEGKRLLDTTLDENSNNVSPLPLTYHIILETYNREPLFASVSNCNNLAYLIFETSSLHKYGMFAFCIMPDHVHLLCRPGNILVKNFIALLAFRFEYVMVKQGYSGPVWHPKPKEYSLTDFEIVTTALFIYENPVRNALVNSGFDYPFSFVLGGKEYRP